MKRKFRKFFAMLLVISLFISNIEPFTVQASGSDVVAMDTDELVFITLAENTDYRWNANGNGDQGNVIHLDTVKGSNCKFKLKKVVDKDGNVSNDDTNYYGIKFIRDTGTDRFADIENKSKDDGKKLHLWESDDNKVKGNEHRQFAFYSAGTDSYGNKCYYIQNRNSGLWLGVEDTNESGKCDKGDKIIQTSELNRKQWIISKAVVPKCGKEAEDIIAAGQNSAFVEIFQKNTIHAINRISDAACKGTKLHLYDVGTSSKWRIDWDATYSAYTIHAVTGGEKDRGSAFTDGGVVWDVSGEDGEKVHLWDEQSKSENQNTSQFWRFIKQDDGSYKIQNARSGLYLALKDDDSNKCFILSDEGMDFEISAFADQTTPINDVNFAYATNWMEKIPDDVSLSSVNIPGTHDTGTASIWEDSWAQVSWTKCQKLYYGEQLNVGARSFDIRCNATKDDASPSDVMIIHGGEKPQCYNRDDSNLTLKDILDDSVRFLEEHSSEALIMTVKQDAGSASGLVHAMSEFIKANKEYVYTGNGIPSMGEARGKIVFMRRYAIDEEVYNPADDGVEKSWFGLDLTNWDNFNYMKNTYALSIYDKDNVSVFVQDAFKADAYDEKRDYIEGTMKQTVGENKDAPKIPADAWVYNYVSTAGIGGIEWPLMQTQGINPWLYEDEINCIDNRRLGMVMMNYIDAPMARLIYETNFKDGNFFATKTTLPTTVTVTCGQRLGEAKIAGNYPYGGKWRFDEEDYIPTWEDFNNGKKFSMTYYSDKAKRQSQTAKVAITDFVKNDIAVTVDSKEITYGDTTPKLTFTCDEGKLQGEDTTEALKITLSIEPKATGKDGRLKAGNWKIQAVSDSENYNVSFTEGTIKVNPKTVNATWSDTTKLKYNRKPQNVTADLTGVLEGDDCTPAVTGGNEVGPSWSGEVGAKPEKYTANLSLTGEDAGNYQLAEGCKSKSYYILREQPGEDEYQFPEKAVLTYGQTLSEATLIGASGAGKFVFVDKDKKTVIGDTKPTAAGTYKSEYYLAFVPENNQEGMVVNSEPTTVEVQKKEIKIIIKDNSRVYGSTKTSPYSFSIAEGDDENSFGTGSFDANYESDNSLGIKLSAGEGEELSANAGTYPITVQSCTNENYKVTAVPGTLTVLKRPISLGWNCEFTYSYTGNPVDITCEVASVNVQFGDYEKSPCEFRVFCNQKVEVGYYKAFAIITNANYTYNAGNALDNGCYYEIVKADPDVTFPSEISLTYGQTLSQAEFTGADSKGIPGEFKIKEETSDSSLLTPSDSGKELEVQFVPQDTKNYNVISKKIPLKVSKKTIVVRAEDQKQIYGDEIAEFAWSMDESQLVGDDSKEGFAFTLTAKKGGSDVSDAIPDAGLYEISISRDEGNSNEETIQKYAFDFRKGSLEIAPREAKIKWLDTTCVVQNGSAPSATIDNLVGPDDCTVTVESDGTDALSYDATTDTWTPYTAKITGLSGADKFNYSLSANEEDLEISYYVLADENDYVMPKEAYLTYGQKRSEVKWSAMAGNGEFLIVDRQTHFNVDDNTILSAGEYNDYAVMFCPASSEGVESDMVYSEITLYVEKKELTVNALPVEKTYGEETKLDFTVDASKLVGEDTKADLGVVLTAIGTSGSEEEKIDGNRINSPVGTYDITMAQCNSENYDVTVVSSMLTIQPKEVSLSWSDVSNLVYSGNPVNVTAKAEGILEGDTCEVKVSNGQKIEAGTYQAIAVSLSNSNYTLPTDLDMLVKEYTIRAIPDLNGLPTVAERVYHPNAPLKDDELTGGNVLDIEGNTLAGTWSWKEQNTIPTVGNDGYEAVFTPSDEDLEYRYTTITKTIAVPVKKAKPYIGSKPVAAAITYGQSLEASKLSGGKVLYGNGNGQAASGENAEDAGNTPVAGTFAWKDATVQPVVADSGKTTYKVVFTPEDSDNYETVEMDITLTVNKADNTPNMPESTMNVPYSMEKVSDVTLPEGWVWQDADKDTDKDTALTVGTAVKATAVYTGADKGNYETESVEISITRLECTHATTEVKNANDATCTDKGYTGDTCCTVCGKVITAGADIDALGHNMTETISEKVAATCTENGKEAVIGCSRCDYTEGGEMINALGHNFADTFTTDKEATCTEAGSKSKHCSRCDAKADVTAIPAKGHTWDAGTVTKAATCTEKGVKSYKCTVDGCDGAKTEDIEALGHDYASEFTVDKEATCAEAGSKSKHCSRCDAKSEVTEIPVDKTKHGKTEIKDVKDATCTEKGYSGDTYCKVCGEKVETGQYINALGHDMTKTISAKVAATCTTDGKEAVKGCSRCDYTEGGEMINALGHNFADTFTTDKEATCTEAGSKSKHCSRCDAKADVTAIPAKGHTWDAGTVTKAATCTEKGVKSYKCTVDGCDGAKTEDIEALGHDYASEFTVDKEATCAEAGSKSKHCSRCDAKSEVTEIPVDKTKHGKTEIKDVKDATCTEKGYSGDTYCKVCGEKVETGQYINALGHDMTKTISAKVAATCTTDGKEAVKGCSRCDYTEGGEKINALGHNFSAEFTVDKEATCAEAGSKSKHCSRCDAKSEVTEIPVDKTKHGKTEIKDVKDATCTEKGYSGDTYCKVCGEKVETGQYINALGHDMTKTISAKVAATCTTDGKEAVKGCSRCDYTEGGEMINALGHNFADTFTTDKEATCTEAGSKSKHCSRCDAKADVTAIPAKGHTWDAGTVTKAATCTEKGVKSYKCTVDGCDGAKTEDIEALGHDYASEFTVDKEATCAEAGSKSKHCSRCDAKSEVTEIPVDKTKHGKTEIKDVKDATCTEKGYSGDTYCKVCGEKVETGQYINALGHDMTKTISAKVAATCTTDGKEAVKGCSRCDYTEGGEKINALGHNFSAEFTVDKEATCAEAGSKSKHCSRCDEVTDVTPIDKLTTHSYVNGVCSVCDDIFKTTVDGVIYQVMTETGADGKPVGKLVTVSGNEIPQVAVAVIGTGDDFAVSDGKVTVPSEITGSGSEQTFVVTKIAEDAFSDASVTEIVIPATVTEVGTGAFGTASTITFKGNTAPSGIAGAITETVTTVNVPEGAADSYRNALGENANIVEVHTHTFDTKWTYDETYHWHAATCGHAEEVSDKAVHTFGEWTVTKEATEDAEGVKERSCSCGYKETAKIDKLAHTIHVKDEGTRVEPTCEKKGSITYKCTKCGEVMEVVELAATGHKWDAGKVTKEATETAEGVKTYTCSVCGKTKTEAIPKKTAITQEPPKKGDVVKDDKTSVKVEVTDVKKKEVEYKEPANKKAKTVSIPATVKIDGVTYKVTKVDDNAFKNNKTVTKVTVGSNIKTIGKNAFSGATKLKTVKIGKNVTEIGANAFKGCSSLTSVTLGSKATKIGANAFSGCKKLKTIKITSTKLTSKTVSKNAFKGLTKATTIKVPKKKLEAYKKLFKQKGLSSKVKVKGY